MCGENAWFFPTSVGAFWYTQSEDINYGIKGNIFIVLSELAESSDRLHWKVS